MRSHILVADDEAPLREIALEVLTEAGYDVTLAADGREALRLLNEHRFDLLLLDEGMPGLTGRDVLALVRAKGSSVPALLWSGHAALSREEQARLAVVEVLRKPVATRALEEAVRRALSAAP